MITSTLVTGQVLYPFKNFANYIQSLEWPSSTVRIQSLSCFNLSWPLRSQNSGLLIVKISKNTKEVDPFLPGS